MQQQTTQLIEIEVNSEPRSVPSGHTVRSLLEFLEIDPSRVAVELNRAIVRKPDWDSTAIDSGARIEIVHFVGGG